MPRSFKYHSVHCSEQLKFSTSIVHRKTKSNLKYYL